MCVPVDAPPILLFSESDKRLDQRPSCSAAACFGPDEQVFKIADRSEAPGMRVEDIIGESYWFARATTGEKAPDRLVRRENALPDLPRNFVGDRAIKGRAITAPSGLFVATVMSRCRSKSSRILDFRVSSISHRRIAKAEHQLCRWAA